MGLSHTRGEGGVMGKYVCDEICTLALDGIRCVIGKNVHYDHGPYWQLEVAYKGVVKNIGYHTEEARDAMYKKIVTHLDGKQVQP